MRLKLSTFVLAVVSLFTLSAPAFADDKTAAPAAPAAGADTAKGGRGIGAGVGAGLAIVGAGIGIGLIGFAALSGIARQPEAAGKIQVNMIVMAALVEGVAIIALLVICYPLLN